MVARIDLTGKRFGRLSVLRFAETRGGKAHWACDCACGSRIIVDGNKLRSGHTRSCGCLKREAAASRATTHGMFGSPEYNSWAHMIRRCHTSSDASYAAYGGRGIWVCEGWRKSFEAFYEDMGPKPSPDHSIDRVDNDGPYGPENCRWATRSEQARNTRSNRILSYGGRTATSEEWGEILGISGSAIRLRLRRGWSVERALTEPVNR